MRRFLLPPLLGCLLALPWRSFSPTSPVFTSNTPQTQRDREVAALDTLEREGGRGFAASAGRLEMAGETLRHGEPTQFEHEWTLAAVSVLGQAACFFPTDGARNYIDHSLSRFPRDSRLQLARILMRPEGFTATNRHGVSKDLLAHSRGLGQVSLGFPSVVRPGTFPPNPRTIPESVRELERLREDPELGDEARAHLALLRFVLGDVEASVAEARSVSSSADPLIRNLAGLVGGFGLDDMGRRPEATESYRLAVQALPQAVSSATALAAHLFLAGQRADAAAVIGSAYAPSANTLDSWPCPVTDERELPARVGRLRAMLDLAAVSTKSGAESPRSESQNSLRDPSPIPSASQAAIHVAATSSASQAPPTFRATSTGVLVDVSVRTGKNPVTGLGPADFEVRDNGVLQTTQSFSIAEVPLDVSLILDTADSGRPAQPGLARLGPQAQAASDAREIAALLRPVDRLRVLVANVRPHEALAMGDHNAGRLTAGGLDWRAYAFSQNSRTAALYDAAAAALIAPVAPDRRGLIVVFTEGIDGLSVLTPDLLISVAKESDALMHVARHDTFGEWARARNPRATDTDSRELLWPKETDVIENAARATGGTARHVGDTESSVNAFKQILDEFRQSYVLHYQPAGVTPGGWHQISVRVTRPGKYDVHARRGYFGG